MNKETLQDIADRYEQNDKETMRLSRAGGKMSELTPQERARTIVLWANGNPGYITTYDGRKALEEQIASVIIDAEAAASERAAQVDGELRSEVLAFARLMEQQLRANDHKPGWKQHSPFSLVTRIDDEINELTDELVSSMPDGNGGYVFHSGQVGKEAADVANFCMMVADVCGALSPEPTARSKQDDPYARSKTSVRAVIKQDGKT